MKIISIIDDFEIIDKRNVMNDDSHQAFRSGHKG